VSGAKRTRPEPHARARPGCRFIAGDPREFRTKGDAIFCNAPKVEGSQWCSLHHSLCWRPLPSRAATNPLVTKPSLD
jgi:hypothetical protein